MDSAECNAAGSSCSCDSDTGSSLTGHGDRVLGVICEGGDADRGGGGGGPQV